MKVGNNTISTSTQYNPDTVNWGSNSIKEIFLKMEKNNSYNEVFFVLRIEFFAQQNWLYINLSAMEKNWADIKLTLLVICIEMHLLLIWYFVFCIFSACKKEFFQNLIQSHQRNWIKENCILFIFINLVELILSSWDSYEQNILMNKIFLWT